MSEVSGYVSGVERLVRTADRWECVHFAERVRRAEFLALTEQGFYVAELPRSALASAEALFAGISAAFAFPEHFGRNWDALADSLADLEWLESDRFVLLIDGASQLTEPLGRLIEVWLSAAQEWSAEGKPFHLVVLRAGGSPVEDAS